jgi:hypothetical protein
MCSAAALMQAKAFACDAKEAASAPEIAGSGAPSRSGVLPNLSAFAPAFLSRKVYSLACPCRTLLLSTNIFIITTHPRLPATQENPAFSLFLGPSRATGPGLLESLWLDQHFELLLLAFRLDPSLA